MLQPRTLAPRSQLCRVDEEGAEEGAVEDVGKGCEMVERGPLAGWVK